MGKTHADRFLQMSLSVPCEFSMCILNPRFFFFIFFFDSPSRLAACSGLMILWYSKRQSHIKLFATTVYCEYFGFLKLAYM